MGSLQPLHVLVLLAIALFMVVVFLVVRYRSKPRTPDFRPPPPGAPMPPPPGWRPEEPPVDRDPAQR